MGRRRSAALRDTAGVYHVASRLAYEGFQVTVARGSGASADVLAGLPGSAATAALTVRTTECPPGFGDGDKGKADVCEWRVGKGAALTADPGRPRFSESTKKPPEPGVEGEVCRAQSSWPVAAPRFAPPLSPPRGPRGEG